MVILRLLPVSFILLFILLQRVDVKVNARDKLTVRIDFNIIAIILSEDKIKKMHLGKISRLLKNLPTIYKILKYLVKKSDVTVIEYNLKEENDVFKTARRYSFYQIIYFYLSANSKSFHINKNQASFDEESEEKSFDFDVLFHFSLFHLINSALILLYYIVKSKAKEVINNV